MHFWIAFNDLQLIIKIRLTLIRCCISASQANVVEIEDLKPGSIYTVVVTPFNDVGDGEPSEAIIVETPEERGIIAVAEDMVYAKQTDKDIRIKIKRTEMTRGRVVVPWSIQSEDGFFNGLKGVEMFKDGEEESHIEIDLPNSPQEADSSSFMVQLGTPTGAAQLSDDSSCQVSVTYNIPFNIIGFPRKLRIKSRQSDGSINIPVTRKGSSEGMFSYIVCFRGTYRHVKLLRYLTD